MKRLSSAVVVRFSDELVLLGHATGTRFWDLPKGLVEAGEAPRQAAQRELEEETGLRLDASTWRDLGRHAYLQNKDVWLFVTPVVPVAPDLASLVCRSLFIDRRGVSRPEFDRFRLASRAQFGALCAPSMARLLASITW